MDDVISPFRVRYKIWSVLSLSPRGHLRKEMPKMKARNDNKNIFLSSFTSQNISWLSFRSTIPSQQEWSFFLLPQINGIVCGCFVGTMKGVKLNVCINFWSIENFFFVYFAISRRILWGQKWREHRARLEEVGVGVRYSKERVLNTNNSWWARGKITKTLSDKHKSFINFSFMHEIMWLKSLKNFS